MEMSRTRFRCTLPRKKGTLTDVNCRNANNQTQLDRAAYRGNSMLFARSSRGRWSHVISWIGSRCTWHHDMDTSNSQSARRSWRKCERKTGESLLYTARSVSTAWNGYLGIVKLLLGHGADVNVVNDEGETPYQISMLRGHQEIADSLRGMAQAEQGSTRSILRALMRCLTGTLILAHRDLIQGFC